MIRVLLADDHALVRAGIHSLLQVMREVQVVGEASSGEEATRLDFGAIPQDASNEAATIAAAQVRQRIDVRHRAPDERWPLGRSKRS